MNKDISNYLLVLILILLGSCKEKNEIHQPELKYPSVSIAPSIMKMDIAKVENAPNVITRTIIEDSNGNIWFATFGGIIKYDGNSFMNITKAETKSRFFSILEDTKGDFWFGSIGSGVYYYDRKTFQNFTTKEGLANDSVTNIYEDKKGNIWFGTLGGATCYDGKVFQNFTTVQGLEDNDINSILEDDEGTFWFGTRGYASIYDGKTFTKIIDDLGNPFANIRHIIKDKNGNIWLGGNGGLWCYKDKEFTNYTKDFVGYIYEDSEGNIWTSSQSSPIQGWTLSKYAATTLENKAINPTEIKTGEGMFFGILEDSNGNIWSGTLNGVYKYDGKTFDDFKL